MAWPLSLPIALAACSWVLSWFAFFRLRSVRRVGGSKVGKPATISVVIPARNEEANLANLIPSLNAQSRSFLEIIVVDDQSEDGTASVARELGATVISGKPLPAGWNGKPWALKQGSDAAKGAWLLFLDADTVALPDLHEELARLAEVEGTAFSIGPYHQIEKLYENLSAFFHLTMNVGTNAFGLRGSDAERVEFVGQCLFVRRVDYDRAGGHESVKDVNLENFHLAGYFRKLGLSCRTYLGKGLVEMRMYPDGYDSLRDGWAKGFSSGVGVTPAPALVGLSLWFSGLSITIVSLILLPYLPSAMRLLVSVLYLLYAIQCGVFFRRIGNYSVFAALLFPVPFLYYLQLFIRGCLRRSSGATAKWKGRDVV